MLGFINPGTEKAVTTQEEADATEFQMGDVLIADGGIETIWPGPVKCQNAAYQGPSFPISRRIFNKMRPNKRKFDIKTLRDQNLIVGTPRTPEQVMAQTNEGMLKAMHERLSPARIADFIDAINKPDLTEMEIRKGDRLADIELLLLSAEYGDELMAVLNDREQREVYLAKIQAIATGLMEDTAQINTTDKAQQSPRPRPNWLFA